MSTKSVKLLLLGIAILLFSFAIAFAVALQVLLNLMRLPLIGEWWMQYGSCCAPIVLIVAFAGLVLAVEGFLRND